tara:strand:+ start:498 stop:1661 length:1164 start_codon:yes stop_codon:yes gene_type:complete
MNKFISSTKSLLVSFSLTVVLIGFSEISFRIIRSFKVYLSNNYSNKRTEEIYKAKFLAFDKKVPISILKKRDKEVGDHLMYKPWIQIGNYDHKSKYSKVISGSRKNIELSDIDCKNFKTIWMFGGSTTYGIGVPSYESIPSKLIETGISNKICLDVFNFGVPYHYSKQETINFVNKLLESDSIPDIAIFLDGLNDFGQASPTIKGEPFFTPRLSNLIGKSSNPFASQSPIINLELINYLRIKLKSSSNNVSYYQLPEGFDQKSAAKEIQKRLLKNTMHLGSICKVYNINCYRFLQPVASIDYTPPSKNVLTSWINDNPKKVQIFKYGYEFIRGTKEFNNLDGISFIDISDIFKNYSGIPYIDAGHYSPRANKLIAEKIFVTINNRLY